MAGFQYIIKDAKGARVEGTLKANSLDEAIDKLTKEGSTIISVKSTGEGAFKGKLSLFDKVMLEKFRELCTPFWINFRFIWKRLMIRDEKFGLQWLIPFSF